MASSVATLQHEEIEPGDGADGGGGLAGAGEELEEVFITDLDNADLSPTIPRTPEEGAAEAHHHQQQQAAAGPTTRFMGLGSTSAAAMINAEWRRLQMDASRDGREPQGEEGCGVPVETRGEVVVSTQPKRISEADVFLQPSQLEEMLGQNSLLLSVSGGADAEKHAEAPQPPGVVRSCSSSSTGLSTVPLDDPIQQPASPSPPPPPHPALSPPGTTRRSNTIWDGFMSCLTPVVGILKKEKRPAVQQDTWEIPFADIRELNFIGSGSQGAVFVGEYLREKVAVKKVKDVTYCQEAKHLRKLSHPNIVKFR